MTLKADRRRADRPPVTRSRQPLRAALAAAAALLATAGLAGCATEQAVTSSAGSGGPAAVVREHPAEKPAADQVDPTAPLPKARPKLVSPVAGETSAAAADSGQAVESADDEMSLPKPTGPATTTKLSRSNSSSVHGLKANKATALPNGVALPPLEAPQAVMEVIQAGNTIARSPYKWGGGHGSFKDNGFDCSGSVSYALYAAGLIGGSATSGSLMAWGKPGKGRWITVYANPGHVFMEVAGIRFDTSGQRVTGSRWQNEFRGTGGFTVRHPPGL
jgi:cell wall-associated NlpC family hydrolase